LLRLLSVRRKARLAARSVTRDYSYVEEKQHIARLETCKLYYAHDLRYIAFGEDKRSPGLTPASDWEPKRLEWLSSPVSRTACGLVRACARTRAFYIVRAAVRWHHRWHESMMEMVHMWTISKLRICIVPRLKAIVSLPRSIFRSSTQHDPSSMIHMGKHGWDWRDGSTNTFECCVAAQCHESAVREWSRAVVTQIVNSRRRERSAFDPFMCISHHSRDPYIRDALHMILTSFAPIRRLAPARGIPLPGWALRYVAPWTAKRRRGRREPVAAPEWLVTETPRRTLAPIRSCAVGSPTALHPATLPVAVPCLPSQNPIVCLVPLREYDCALLRSYIRVLLRGRKSAAVGPIRVDVTYACLVTYNARRCTLFCVCLPIRRGFAVAEKVLISPARAHVRGSENTVNSYGQPDRPAR